jgi:hypothetical protein
MLKKLILGLASAAVLTMTALTPALADIPTCMKFPNPDTCPYGGSPKPANNQEAAHNQTRPFDNLLNR